MLKSMKIFVGSVLLLITMGCSSDSNVMGVPDADLNGLWSLVADLASVPETLSCTDGHAGLSNMALCSPIAVNIQQNGDSFTGSSQQVFCGYTWTVTGTVSGDNVAGILVADDGVDIHRISFDAVVTAADSMVVGPKRFTIDGLTGSCLVTGRYVASR